VNYIILGHIIDTLDTPWETMIKDQLWTPLGMNECGFGTPPESAPGAIENPWPHTNGSDGPVPVDPFSTGAEKSEDVWTSGNSALLYGLVFEIPVFASQCS
jgi:CubicO group peptidase (beta-lactamase class C family)